MELPRDTSRLSLFTTGCQTVLAPSLRAFLETLHEAILEVDSRGELRWMNPEGRRLIAPLLDDTRSRMLAGAVAEQDRPDFDTWLGRCREGQAASLCIVKLAGDSPRRLIEFQRWSPPSSNPENHIWILARDLSAWALQMEQVRIRDRLLGGIAQANQELLLGKGLDTSVAAALKALGVATGVDRVYLFENHEPSAEGEVLTSQRFEWCQSGIAPQINNPDLQAFAFSSMLPQEFQTMAAGGVVGGPLRSVGPALREVLKPQGIASVLLVPITIEQQFWGFVGFDECHWERDWTQEERATLKSFAGTLGLVIQRQRSLQQIQKSERELQLIIDGSNDGFWDWNVPEGAVRFSPRLLEMLGYQADSWNGTIQEWAKRVHPEDMPAVMREITNHVEGRTAAYQSEHRLQTASGDWHWILDRGKVAERDAGGRALRVVGVHTDIQPLKNAQALLDQRTQLLQGLFDAVPLAVLVLDAAGVIRQANPGAGDLFLTRSEDLVGTSASALLPIEPCSHEGGPTRFRQVKMHRKDGQELVLEVSETSIGQACQGLIVAVIRDISEEHRSTQQTLRALEREKELNRLHSNFIALVSHEFRTPLAHILMSAEMLQDCYDQMPPTRRTDCFASIKSRVRSLTNMMQDVLTLGALESGGQSFDPKPVELASYCEGVVKEFRESLSPIEQQKAPAIRMELNGTTQPALLDPRILSRILVNLLSNAVKYSPKGAGEVVFRLGVRDNELLFEIKDEGIGVPAEDRPRLFTNFFRARNAKSIPGTGIGLSIVALCADLHGGSVRYRPGTPAGSVFSVAIPCSMTGLPRQEAAPHSSPHAGASHP